MKGGLDCCVQVSSNEFLVVFPSFSFAEAVSPKRSICLKNCHKTEQKDTLWNDGLARVGVSSDDVPIVYSLPGLLLAAEQVGCVLYFSFLSSPITSH